MHGQEQRDAPAAAAPPAGSGRVLIVDDAADVLTFLRRALEDEGYAVEEARDGAEAIAAVRRFRPDVIVLDLMMANVSGWDFLGLYRQAPGPHVPIVVISAIPPRNLDLRRLDAEDVLSKPFSIDRLLDVIRTRLGGSRLDRP